MHSFISLVSLIWERFNEWILVLAISIAAWQWPLLGDPIFRRFERFAEKIAAHKTLAIAAIGLFVIVLRVVLLPWFPIRHPGVPDEFSYLLAGDTFVHGRLTNPPHPMAIYLDTLQVIQAPTYQSMYPPAQGGVVALGLLLGHPWIGILLSVVVMFALLLWALQGWLPTQWALVGATISLLRYGIFSYWMNSYYGGAAAAIGGCLLAGSLPRIVRHRRVREALLFGLGAGILANSRPYEGLLAFAPAAVYLLLWHYRNRSDWQINFRRVLAPIALSLVLCGTFTLYYNYRVTGDMLLFPHTVDDRMHLPASNFVWSSEHPEIHFLNHEFDVEFNHYSRNYFRHTWGDFLRITRQKAQWFEDYYLGPALLLPCMALPWVLLDHRARILQIQLLIYFAGAVLVVWYTPHYTAPVLVALTVILVQSIRHIRRWNYQGRPVGIGLTRAIAVMCLFSFFIFGRAAIARPSAGLPLGWGWYSLDDRAADQARLEALPGKHLIIVRYSQTTHNPAKEWVHNAADVDGSKVVWAREIPTISMQPLLDYYRDRTVWLVEPDRAPSQIVPFRASFSGTLRLTNSGAQIWP